MRNFLVKDAVRAGYATLIKLIGIALTLSFGVVGVRLLGTETFGAYVSLFTIAGILTVATSIGLPALLQREIASGRGNGDNRALKPLVQGLTLVNIVLIIALAGAFLAGSAATISVLSFSLAGNLTGVLTALYIGHEKIMLAKWLGDILRPLIALIALVFLIFIWPPSELLPLAAQTISAGVMAIAFILLWNGRPLSDSRRAFAGDWWSDRHRSIVRAGLIFAGTQILINLTTQVDILILTLLAEPQDVAHYYAAVRAAMVISFFFGASGMLAEPVLTKFYAAGEQGKVQALATRTAIAGSIVTIVAAAIASLLAPYYLQLYGPSFAVALPSFCVFAAGVATWSLFGPGQQLLRATRADRELLIVTAMALGLNAALTAALVPLLGILGAAIGSALQFVVYGATLAVALNRRTGIRSDIFALRFGR